MSDIAYTTFYAELSKTKEERDFYVALAAKEHYSSRELERQLDSAYYERYMLSSGKQPPELVPQTVRNTILDTYVLELERSQLINLQWDAFTNNFKYITVKNRKIELPPIIQEYLIKLNNEKKKEKIRSPFLFQVLYQKRYKPMKEWNINDVFNKCHDVFVVC